MNILICSAGRRVKLIKYFKEELNKIGGKVIAVDCDSTAPALHFADIMETVSPINDPMYIQDIKILCKKYQINAVLSLIDPELSILADKTDEFLEDNIQVIVSDKKIVDMCFDKYLTYKILKRNNIPAVPAFLSLNEVLNELENKHLTFPLIVKPRTGSASIGVRVAKSVEELENMLNTSEDLIVQPFMAGDEYGIDCYVDLISNKPTHLFCKRKIKMRAGETDKSVAVKDQNLVEIIEDLLNKLKLIGPIDIDCFKTESGYVISEINPRFGGGYPHSHEAGQNFVKCIVNNLKGISNQSQIGDYQEESVMIKFDDVMLLN
ncbi:MAG: carbamoylphosphate synthase large subunit [Neobacillus sp.]|nr:carbamoylphosphate synthase large subunit [Neobacillus sp.]